MKWAVIAAFSVATWAFDAAGAEGSWIDLRTEADESLKAFIAVPDGAAKRPAVIYNHGTFVRRLGADQAARQGYDVREFVKALTAAGYVAIAPVRNYAPLGAAVAKKGDIGANTPEQFVAAVEQGMRAVQAALAHLEKTPTVDTGRIGIVGFSEGGLVTAWSASDARLRAIVLMSPAPISEARPRNMKAASESDQFARISAPILVTVGKLDEPAVINSLNQTLIPKLVSLGKAHRVVAGYPGNHAWFYRPRSEYWDDVISFLDSHLK